MIDTFQEERWEQDRQNYEDARDQYERENEPNEDEE